MAHRLLQQDDHHSDASKAQGLSSATNATQGAEAKDAPSESQSASQSGGYEQFLEDVEDEGLLLLIDDELLGSVS